MPKPEVVLVQNVIDLRRFENGLRSRITRVVEDTLREISSVLVNRYSDLTLNQRTRLAAMLRRSDAMLATAYNNARKLSQTELSALARIQGRFAEQVIQSAGASANVEIATTRLTPLQLQKIAEMPVQGLPVSDWWRQMGQQTARDVRRHIQLGLSQGEPVQAIVRRIAPLDPRLAPSAMLTARRQATAMVRTMVTATSNEASFATFSNLDPDVSDSYQYVATLDDRTTVICASLDGQIFRYDDPAAPRPPMHINCRSTIIPVVNWEKLGVSPPEKLLPMTRASQGGPVTYRTYSSWLRQQPAATQDHVLGPTRGAMFRKGEVSLSDLVRSDGTQYTVAQLEQRVR